MEVCDNLLDCGFNKPLPTLKMCDVDPLIKCVALHYTVLKIKSELDQFMSGLDEAGCLNVIQKFPHLMRPLFVAPNTPNINAGIVHI